MSLWDHLSPEDLIDVTQAGNYGLAPKKWHEQLEQIRALPETRDASDERLEP